MRFLILFIFLITNAIGKELPEIKNVVIHKNLKTYDNLIFLDKNDQKIDIKNFKEKLVLLNFWATWCEPCKEEMPSLDALKVNPKLNNIKIFPINIGKESLKKSEKFFKDFGTNKPPSSAKPFINTSSKLYSFELFLVLIYFIYDFEILYRNFS